jgi:hypothetical protein
MGGGNRICYLPINKTLRLTGKTGDCINENPPSADLKGDYH